MGLKPGQQPLVAWDGLRERGKYQVLADIFSWNLTQIHAAERHPRGLRSYYVVVTEHQARECVPYHSGAMCDGGTDGAF